jgi:hypothetical protein
LYKVNIDGSELWSYSYGGPRIESFDDVEVLNDGSGYIVVGQTDSFGPGCPDPGGNYFVNVYVVKTDLAGVPIWEVAYGGEQLDCAFAVTETNDSCFIVVGENQSVSNGSSGYMLKLDQNGDTLWTKTYHNDPDSWGYVRFSDVVRYYDGFLAVGRDAYDHLYIVATDDVGDTVWTDTLDIGTNEYARMITGDADEYLITGGVKIGPSANPVQPFLMSYGPTTGINSQGESVLPGKIFLEQNYPNPFNATTTISYSIEKPGMVSIEIYDLLGRSVDTIINETKLSGRHSIIYDASALPTGVYFYKITAGEQTETGRMMLLK